MRGLEVGVADNLGCGESASIGEAPQESGESDPVVGMAVGYIDGGQVDVESLDPVHERVDLVVRYECVDEAPPRWRRE